jgi:hypothetical protein
VRAEVEFALGFGEFSYQQDRSLPSPSETREHIGALRALAEKLEKGLWESASMLAMISLPDDMPLSSMTDEKRASQPWKFPTRPAAYRQLNECALRLRYFIRWATIAERRLPRARTGNKTDAVHELVEHLNDLLWRHTGKRATRNDSAQNARMEFIQECLDQLNIGRNADAMIRAAARRRQSLAKKNP